MQPQSERNAVANNIADSGHYCVSAAHIFEVDVCKILIWPGSKCILNELKERDPATVWKKVNNLIMNIIY